MHAVQLNIFKYPRRQRYTLAAYVVRDEADYLMLYSPVGAELFSHEKQTAFNLSQHIVDIFWPGRYYNVEIFYKADWTFKGYYVNLALPYERSKQQCVYVDLELDISHFAGEPIKILDEDEYEETRLKYNFSQDLVGQIETAKNQAIQLLQTGAFPFDGPLILWRPEVEQ